MKIQYRLAECLKLESKTLLNQAGIKKISTIYFGGGSPSLMAPNMIEEIIYTCTNETGQVPSYIEEITLEINPNKAMNVDNLKAFTSAGVTRFSIGLQSLDNNVLKWMNRDHDMETAEKVIKTANQLANLSVDLIFARPEQTVPSWRKELQTLFQKFPFLTL